MENEKAENRNEILKNLKILKIAQIGMHTLIARGVSLGKKYKIRLDFPEDDDYTGILALPHEQISANDVYYGGKVLCDVQPTLKIEDDNDIAERTIYVQETYEDYLRTRDCRVKELKGDTELGEDDDFVITRNSQIKKFNLMVKIKRPAYVSIRDIEDASILKRAKDKIGDIMAAEGIERERVLMFIYYSPKIRGVYVQAIDLSWYSLCPGFPGWPVYLDTAVKNIEIDGSYYKKPMNYVEVVADASSEGE